MNHSHPLLKGTLILTFSGFLCRFAGFFYRIFLSNAIGAQAMGIYQLTFPVYSFCAALCVSGIQTSIMRCSASWLALEKKESASFAFACGSLVSLVLSLAVSLLVFLRAEDIGRLFLEEPRTVPLLRLLVLAFPLSAFHSCTAGYYYGRSQAKIPAILQIWEQVFRISVGVASFYLLTFETPSQKAVTAVLGILAGEAASCAASLFFLSKSFRPSEAFRGTKEQKLPVLREIVTLSLPLTANKVCLTLLHAVENVLIPRQLRLFGLSVSDSLSLFGIFSGMALPILLFPSTVTNSAAVMLLPSVAGKQAKKEAQSLSKTIRSTAAVCLALGCGCFLLFFAAGPFLGRLLFQNESAGQFLRTLSFACPFLYLNGTLLSILNGLGKTGKTFLHNLAALSIRILFAFFAIPAFGMKGYLWGLLAGELTLTALNLWGLRKEVL